MSDDRLYQIRPRRSSGPWRALHEARRPDERPGSRYEFAPGADRPPAIGRRGFMHMLGAGTLVSACSRDVPPQILPYTRRPVDVTIGQSNLYATSMEHAGFATGLLVESREGRPLKVEANLDHPQKIVGTSVFHQACVWQLYDDCRGRRPRRGRAPDGWNGIIELLRADRADGGAGLRLLLPPTPSPLLHALLDRIRQRHPLARVSFHAPIVSTAELDGAQLAFGRRLQPHYDLAADVVLSLDADLLSEHPNALRHAAAWAARRRLAQPTDEMNRLYVVENMLSVTGSMADHRLRRRASEVPAVAAAIAGLLPGMAVKVNLPGTATPHDERWLREVARDLARRPAGSTLVVAGERQPAAVQALAFAMNAALGNIGRTLRFSEPVLPAARPDEQRLDELVADMRAGRVDTLVMLECNPVYSAPADLGFADALAKVDTSVCFDYYENETADRSDIYGPVTHFLEAWGDSRSYDGTVSLIQPLIRPLVDARTPSELLATMAGERQPFAYGLLRDFWTSTRGLDETSWQTAVQSGFIPDSAVPIVNVTLDAEALAGKLAGAWPESLVLQKGDELEIDFLPSPTVYDGRYANNAWLQEQPSPIVKLTWDNAVFMSPATALRLGLHDEQVIALDNETGRVRGPVLVVPGMADDAIAVWLGYGRKGQEQIASLAGFSAYPLRSVAQPHFARVRFETLPGSYPLAHTQRHFDLHGRPIAFRRSLAEYRAHPQFTEHHKGEVISAVADYEYTGHQWAMTIDTTICTGCSACMVACQSENNVPVVGKENVLNSREMHWLRIDTYFEGEPDDPVMVHQPMLCQHCEKAPCEYVCPVNATVHSPDGLNEMVYNRCIGTRFCSNNCPYKVRRFNFFDYGERLAVNRGLVQLKFNPEVTVRERGVMEKCTYCVQRIRRGDIEARLEGRDIRPGEIVTACQQACPTGAIQFGSLAHRDTAMVAWRQQPRGYAVLHELGTQPRTHYLARIDNPNPALRTDGTRPKERAR